jgi:AAA ATPase domain
MSPESRHGGWAGVTVQPPPRLLGRVGELEVLRRLLADVRGGKSAVLVVRGEPGIGKTALLGQLAAEASGFQVVRGVGVESEMELPYAGLHQLCAPMLARLDRLRHAASSSGMYGSVASLIPGSMRSRSASKAAAWDSSPAWMWLSAR